MLDSQKHPCNWPNCEKMVHRKFWGCPHHSHTLPPYLLAKWWKTINLFERQQTDEHIEAGQRIQEWIKGNPDADKNRTSMPPLELFAENDFAAGLTDDGRVFLLWPSRLEYITLTKPETAVAIKAIRAMYTKDPEPPAPATATATATGGG